MSEFPPPAIADVLNKIASGTEAPPISNLTPPIESSTINQNPTTPKEQRAPTPESQPRANQEQAQKPNKPEINLNGQDPYEILGLPKNATTDQIRSAFFDAARRWHPDTNNDPAALEAMKIINNAYDSLAKKPKPAEYSAAQSVVNIIPEAQMDNAVTAGLSSLTEIYHNPATTPDQLAAAALPAVAEQVIIITENSTAPENQVVRALTDIIKNKDPESNYKSAEAYALMLLLIALLGIISSIGRAAAGDFSGSASSMQNGAEYAQIAGTILRAKSIQKAIEDLGLKVTIPNIPALPSEASSPATPAAEAKPTTTTTTDNPKSENNPTTTAQSNSSELGPPPTTPTPELTAPIPRPELPPSTVPQLPEGAIPQEPDPFALAFLKAFVTQPVNAPVQVPKSV